MSMFIILQGGPLVNYPARVFDMPNLPPATLWPKAGMMMNGIDEEAAVANFIYYKSVLTGESSDPTLTAELDALVKQYTEDVNC